MDSNFNQNLSLAPDIPQDVPSLVLQAVHHGGSRSILHGLAPDLDSDYSNDQATLPLRSARSEVDVQRAGVSMELGSTRLCMWPTSAICITVVLGCLGTYSLTFWLEAGIVEM